MKVLIITNHPIEKKQGGCMASRAFINAFSAIFSDCTLIFPDTGRKIDHLVHPALKKIPCIDKRPRWIKGIGIYFGQLHRFRPIVRKWLLNNKPDLVIFDTVIVSQGIIDMVKRATISIITIHHNVEIDYFSDNKLPFIIHFPYLFHIGRAEKKALMASKLNLTLTENDSIRFKKLYSSVREINLRCIGVFEPEEKKEIGPAVRCSVTKNADQTNMVITGSLGYAQNYLSIIEFILNYLPVLNDLNIKYVITIAGSKPSKKLMQICEKYDAIKLIPDPLDISSILNDADIYLCPVSRGSGLKLRIMEGIKTGKPTIVHDISSRGYEVFIKAGMMFSYNSPENFKIALERALNTYLNEEDVNNLFKEHFCFKSGITRLKNLLKENALI